MTVTTWASSFAADIKCWAEWSWARTAIGSSANFGALCQFGRHMVDIWALFANLGDTRRMFGPIYVHICAICDTLCQLVGILGNSCSYLGNFGHTQDILETACRCNQNVRNLLFRCQIAMSQKYDVGNWLWMHILLSKSTWTSHKLQPLHECQFILGEFAFNFISKIKCPKIWFFLLQATIVREGWWRRRLLVDCKVGSWCRRWKHWWTGSFHQTALRNLPAKCFG